VRHLPDAGLLLRAGAGERDAAVPVVVGAADQLVDGVDRHGAGLGPARGAGRVGDRAGPGVVPGGAGAALASDREPVRRGGGAGDPGGALPACRPRRHGTDGATGAKQETETTRAGLHGQEVVVILCLYPCDSCNPWWSFLLMEN